MSMYMKEHWISFWMFYWGPFAVENCWIASQLSDYIQVSESNTKWWRRHSFPHILELVFFFFVLKHSVSLMETLAKFSQCFICIKIGVYHSQVLALVCVTPFTMLYIYVFCVLICILVKSWESICSGSWCQPSLKPEVHPVSSLQRLRYLFITLSSCIDIYMVEIETFWWLFEYNYW